VFCAYVVMIAFGCFIKFSLLNTAERKRLSDPALHLNFCCTSQKVEES
jgi:hypothetical protein